MRRHSSAQKRPASEANSLAIPASMSERWPASFRLAALRVSRRAASTWVAMSASLNWIAWCSAIGLPKVRRSWAYLSASSRARWARPTPRAATLTRPSSRASIIWANPLLSPACSPPRTLSARVLGFARFLLGDEAGQASVLGLGVRIGADEDEDEPGPQPVGHPHLGAVDLVCRLLLQKKAS